MKFHASSIFVALGLLVCAITAGATQCQPWATAARPRLFILSDISNEPDDTMSFIRLLLHSDLYDLAGLTATTSYWLPNATYPDQIQDVIDAYATVRDNLQTHSQSPFPAADYLSSVLASGPTTYGMAAIADLEAGGELSKGSQNLIAAADASHEPLYIPVWGGANTLASALWYVNGTRSAEDVARFISKLRVYAISDQDDSGPWIRMKFPDLFFIASRNGFNQYNLAAWTGISGEELYSFDEGGPDSSLVSKEWLKQNVQIGPLGKLYPDVAYIMEGDTPSLLYHIPNGLGHPEHPGWGSWGGRYTANPVGSKQYADAVDFVRGQNGRTFVSNHATIWRWREAYQNEMAARMQWTLQPNGPASNASHPPVVVVNGSCGAEPLELQVNAGDNITLDASSSFSPDNSTLAFSWFHYREPTSSQWTPDEVSTINITSSPRSGGRIVEATVPSSSSGKCVEPADVTLPGKYSATAACQSHHVVLAVKSTSVLHPITRYKRIILHVQP